MPLYTFRNITTNEFVELDMKIAEREQFLNDHPQMEHVLMPIRTIDSVKLGVHKTPDSFRDLLKTINKRNTSRSLDSTIKF